MWRAIGVMAVSIFIGVITWQIQKIAENYGKFHGEKSGVKEYRQHFRHTRFKSLRQQIEGITGKMSTDTWYAVCRTATKNIKANRRWLGQRTYIQDVIDTLHKARNFQTNIDIRG
jgi:hypothetical protein